MTKPFLLRLALALPLAGLVSCASLFSSPDNSLTMADSLLDRVERMHVESVLSRERMKEALVSLRAIVSPDFEGDALASFALFVDAVDRSEEQQRRLSGSVGPMERSANKAFEAWSGNVQAIGSESLKRHGKGRLLESKERYDTILESLVPAQETYAQFNARLRDHALFLGLDYTASAVSELGQEVSELLDLARSLDSQFRACEEAAETYVRESALRGQVQITRAQARVSTRGKAGDASADEFVASNNR